MLRIILQSATFAIVLLTALAGVSLYVIQAEVGAQVKPLQEKVATLEKQGAAIAALQKDVSQIREDLAATKTDVEWIRAALQRIEAATKKN